MRIVEELSKEELDFLQKEYNEVLEKIKNSSFIDPEDVKKRNELLKQLIGIDFNEIKVGNIKSSNRVTSFTKDRR